MRIRNIGSMDNKKNRIAWMFKKSILSVGVIILLAQLAVPVASANDAAHSMDRKTIGRQFLFIASPDGAIRPGNINAFLSDAKAIGTDSVLMSYDICWLAAQYTKDPNMKYPGSPNIISDANLKSVIKTLHDNDMTVIISIHPQVISAAGEGYCKDYFSNNGAWYPKRANLSDAATVAVDFYYSEA